MVSQSLKGHELLAPERERFAEVCDAAEGRHPHGAVGAPRARRNHAGRGHLTHALSQEDGAAVEEVGARRRPGEGDDRDAMANADCIDVLIGYAKRLLARVRPTPALDRCCGRARSRAWREALRISWGSEMMANSTPPEVSGSRRAGLWAGTRPLVWLPLRSDGCPATLVHHIRWLIGFQGANADKAEANRNWNDDLAWIRKVLAPRAGVRGDVASP